MGREPWPPQALVEFVRELDLGRYGYKQMQVDAEYLRQRLWRFVAQERCARARPAQYNMRLWPMRTV